MNKKISWIIRIAILTTILCLFTEWSQQAIAGLKNAVKGKKTVEIQKLTLSGEKIKEENGWSIFRDSKGGYYFFSSDVERILPSEPNDPRIQKYSSHCVFKQSEHDENIVMAYVDTNDPSQCIIYGLNLAFDEKGNIRAKYSLSLWCNGSIHEYEGRVTLGPPEKRYIFETIGTSRLVFEVSDRLGYIYRKGTGKVAFPDGSVVEYPNREKSMSIGIGRFAMSTVEGTVVEGNNKFALESV